MQRFELTGRVEFQDRVNVVVGLRDTITGTEFSYVYMQPAGYVNGLSTDIEREFWFECEKDDVLLNTIYDEVQFFWSDVVAYVATRNMDRG